MQWEIQGYLHARREGSNSGVGREGGQFGAWRVERGLGDGLIIAIARQKDRIELDIDEDRHVQGLPETIQK